jgi:hypothetical protein
MSGFRLTRATRRHRSRRDDCNGIVNVVSDQSAAGDAGDPVWKVLRSSKRPWWRRASAQTLAQVEVVAPDTVRYLVRVSRNAPIAGGADALRGGDVSSLAGLVVKNVGAFGDTGWTIAVLEPATAWRSERVIFRQPVNAVAIVADVALVIADAVQRGEILWDE